MWFGRHTTESLNQSEVDVGSVLNVIITSTVVQYPRTFDFLSFLWTRAAHLAQRVAFWVILGSFFEDLMIFFENLVFF